MFKFLQVSCRRSEASREDSLDGGECQDSGAEYGGVLVRESRSAEMSCLKNWAVIATRATPIRMYREVITIEKTSSVEFLELPSNWISNRVTPIVQRREKQ